MRFTTKGLGSTIILLRSLARDKDKDKDKAESARNLILRFFLSMKKKTVATNGARAKKYLAEKTINCSTESRLAIIKGDVKEGRVCYILYLLTLAILVVQLGTMQVKKAGYCYV